jgi:hypothetical protein
VRRLGSTCAELLRHVRFIFDGGVIREDLLGKLRPCDDELDGL